MILRRVYYHCRRGLGSRASRYVPRALRSTWFEGNDPRRSLRLIDKKHVWKDNGKKRNFLLEPARCKKKMLKISSLSLLERERLGGVFREDLGIVALYETKRGTFRLLKWHFTVVEMPSTSRSNIFLPLIDYV